MFELGSNKQQKEMNEIKYAFEEHKELQEKELLSLEKEMLGIYISGHPLEKMRHQIESQISVNSLILKEIGMQNSLSESEISSEIAIDSKVISKYKDGQNVKFAGIITSIKKKYTKNNKILTIDITNASEEEKKKLRGAIRYFNGDKNNVNIQIKIGNEIKHCGQIYLTDEILTIFETIIGKEKIIY